MNNVKVVDLSCYLSSSFGTMMLADYGAEVIKVEQPGKGDPIRTWGNTANGRGLLGEVVNRNKKSVTADLRTKEGVDRVKTLVTPADVLVENFRPGTLENWGLGPTILHEVNPSLIIVRVSGYGQTGPYSPKAGFGTAAEAMSGFAYANGYPGLPPLLPNMALADVTSGLMAAYLIMVALNHRDNCGGGGQVIDLALYETLFSMLGSHVVDYTECGIVQKATGSQLSFSAPRNVYKTGDDCWVAISASGQRIYEKLCSGLGRLDLIDDERFVDNPSRVRNRDVLDEELQSEIQKLNLPSLLEVLDSSGAVVSPVLNIEMIMKDRHFAARENIVSVDVDFLDEPLQMQGVVGKLSGSPGKIRSSAPELGAHDDEFFG